MSSKNTYYEKTNKNQKKMHKIVIIQRIVNENKKDMKITKEGFNKKREIVTEIFWKKKKTLKKNMEEIDVRTCLKKINKN